MRANETYLEAKSQFSVRNRNLLMNAQSPHKWWCSSLPPFVGGGGGLVCESAGKADLLSDHFDDKQSRESVDLPLACHPSLRLTTFAADVLAPHLSVVFRRLIRLGSFPACWKQTNVTSIPKSPPFSSVANYRPFCIASV